MARKGKREAARKGRTLRWRRWVVLPLCCAMAATFVLGAVARPAEAPVQAADAGPLTAQEPAAVRPDRPRLARRLPAPQPPPEEPPYDFSQPAPESHAVDESYFADAVFLGDSRTDGLRLYSGIRGPDFINHNGLTVFDVEEKRVIKGEDGKKRTPMEAMELGDYGKVYIMLGINELGYGNDQKFYDTYAQIIDSVRACQPEAVIYIEAIVPINPLKAKESKQKYYISNERIGVFNDLLRQLAEEKRVVYLDLSAALTDESGVLPYEASTDGIHFKKNWYQKWYEYLKNHTVSAEDYGAGQTAPPPETPAV